MTDVSAENPGETPGVGRTSSRFVEIASAGSPLALSGGQTLGPVSLAYEIYGSLNAAADNAILVFHALSGSQHAAGFNPSVPEAGERWTEEMHTGWWDDFIGPGRALDTERFAVICVNYLGGCYGSTGPVTVNPATGRPYGSAFPRISLVDIVDSQMRLLDLLGVRRLHAVVGASVGGLMCLSLATRYPDRVTNVIPIASGLTVTALQRIHIFEQCLAIETDRNFDGGDYYDGAAPDMGLALARMIGHKSFVSLHTMEERARWEVAGGERPGGHVRIVHPLESYMWHQGTKFVGRFDANTYLRIMEMWQTFEMLEGTGAADLASLLSRCREQRFMVFTIDTDVCYYPEEQEQLVAELKRAGVPVRRITVHSENGHDAFLLEPELFAPHLIDTLSGTNGA